MEITNWCLPFSLRNVWIITRSAIEVYHHSTYYVRCAGRLAGKMLIPSITPSWFHGRRPCHFTILFSLYFQARFVLGQTKRIRWYPDHKNPNPLNNVIYRLALIYNCQFCVIRRIFWTTSMRIRVMFHPVVSLWIPWVNVATDWKAHI